MKFGRTYTMRVQGNLAMHTINFPLTCHFQIHGAGMPGGTTASFRLYNLSEDVRHDVRKDVFQQLIYRQIRFAAGYLKTDVTPATAPSLPVIFQGNVFRACSYREGPNWVTEIEAWDGGAAIQNAQVQLSVPSPYNAATVLRQMVQSMSRWNVTAGAIGDFLIPNARGRVFEGATWDLLTRLAAGLEGTLTIWKEKVYLLQQKEYVQQAGALSEISEATGLLDSPRHEENFLLCRMMFEPRLEMFQNVAVLSVEPGNSAPEGKVMRIDHRGVISAAVCGDAITDVQVMCPGFGLIPVTMEAGRPVALEAVA